MLTQVRCRWRSPEGDEERYSVDECRACASTGINPCGYPLPIILQATRDRDKHVVQSSATMFASCPREQAIKANYDWAVSPELAYTRSFGSLVHQGAETTVNVYLASADELERQRLQEVIETEHRYARPYILPDGQTAIVTSQLDILYKTERGSYTIRDYKVVDSVTDAALTRKVASYIPQFSIQRWILAGLGMRVERIDLDFLTQKKPRIVNLFPDGERAIPTASLMSLEETEHYFDERLPILFQGLSNVCLPGVLTSPQEWWRCRFCDVQQTCSGLYGKATGRPLPGLSAR